jgi:very-short-patch-repair endonuclease/transposase
MKLYQDKEWLNQKVMIEGLSHKEVSEMCGVAKTTIADWCIKLRVVKAVKPKNRDYGANTINLKSGEWLREHYIDKEMSLSQIAKQEGVGKTTVRKALDKFNISTRIPKKTIVSCTNCGKDVFRKPCRVDASFFYCSYECSSEYMKTNYPQNELLRKGFNKWVITDEAKLFMRQNGINLSESIRKNDTSIERAIRAVLQELNVDFEEQVHLGYYFVDFYLPQFNLVVECNGDYWHHNPLTQLKEPSDRIKKNVTRDKSKKTFLKNRNYNLLVLWENEINSDIDWCKREIINQMNVQRLSKTE